MPSEPSPLSPTAKIIELAPRQQTQKDGGRSGLLAPIQAKAKDTLNEALARAFKAADDDLFRRSESGDALFFAGLRALRLRTPLITRLFMERVGQSWSLQAASPGVRGDQVVASELSLVEDSELEESLALSSMVAPVETTQAGEIGPLRQRWAMLKGGQDPDSVTVPCAPNTVATAFQDALTGLEDLDLPVRIVLYKHFERHVMADLGPVYHQINEDLVAAGILPDLRPQQLIRPYSGLADSSAGSSPNPTAGPPQQALGSAGPGAQAWDELRQLVANSGRTPPSGGTAGSGGSLTGGGFGSPVASLRELGEAIAALREIHHLLGEISASGVAPHQVKEHLLQKLGKDTAAARSLGEHEASIDAIGLLFDHILKDSNLPPPIQALLARLQLPFIRVAVAEPHLFGSEDQAARKLLNVLGEAGKGWSAESDKDHSLFARIESVVQAINDRFNEDPKIFDQQLALFQEQQAEVARRSQVTEQRSEEVARNRDKLEAAKAIATKELVERTAGRPLPEWARAMLLRHWMGYLVLLVRRDGNDSPAFRRALFFVEKVVDAQSEKDDAGRRALATLIPSLVQQLKEGLGAVGVGSDEAQSLSKTFEAFLIQRASGSSAPLPPLPALNLPAVPEKKGPQPKPESLEKVKAVRLNDWIEFVDEKGQKTRGKVSWISSFTGRLLLVTVQGLRLGEKTPDELALMFERDQARIMESKPLFDRAMGSIMGRLKH